MNKLNAVKNKSIAALRTALSIDIFKLMPQWWRGESKAAKAAFYAALIIGFVSHLFIYTGRYFGNHDLAMITNNSPVYASGRWLNRIVSLLDYSYLMPLIHGALVTLFLATAAFHVCKIFQIEKKANAIIMALLMVTFPSIAVTNLFLIETASYHLAALLAVCAIYVTMRFGRGFIAGALLLMCTLAIYQAMFNVAAALCLFVLIIRLISADFEWKTFGKAALNFLLMGLFGGAFYALSLLLNQWIFGRELSGYKGMSFESMGERLFTIRGMAEALQRGYGVYFDSLFGGSQYLLTNPLRIAYVSLFALFALALIFIITERKIYQQVWRMILLGLFILLIPLASNFSQFLDTGYVGMHRLYALSLVFVFFLPLSEQTKGAYALIKSLLLFGTAFIVASWIIICNVYYLQAWFFNQTTNAITTRIVARMEPFLAESAAGKVAIFGSLPSEYMPAVSNEFTESGNFLGPPLGNRAFIGLNMRSLKNLHGLNVSSLRVDEGRNIVRGKVLDMNMPVWPLEGSIAAIDGAIVVNLGATDIISEYADGILSFRARHFVGASHQDHEYEYHWRVRRNGFSLVYDGVSAQDSISIEAGSLFDHYEITVIIKNLNTGYIYRETTARVGFGDYGSFDAPEVLPAYLLSIQDENHIILLSAKDEASTNLSEAAQAALHALGLKENLRDKYRHAYAAIIDGHAVVFEDVSATQVHHLEQMGSTRMELNSAGYESGNMGSILIDGMEYSPNMRGLNIVVYDKAAGMVVDAVNFDTYEAPEKLVR